MGEAAALALAIETHSTALLADDLEARLEAQKAGIAVVGTVAIIAAAHRAALLDFDTIVKSLQATSFHIHEQVIVTIRSALTPSEGNS